MIGQRGFSRQPATKASCAEAGSLGGACSATLRERSPTTCSAGAKSHARDLNKANLGVGLGGAALSALRRPLGPGGIAASAFVRFAVVPATEAVLTASVGGLLKDCE